MYEADRQKEIISKFQNLLKEADNFNSHSSDKDYRHFWSGLRGEGSNLLGLTLHLSEQLNNAAEIIQKMEKEKELKEGV